MSNTPGFDYEARLPLLRGMLWGGAALLYAIPVVAKLIGGEDMLWTRGDFVIAAIGILIAAGLVDLGLRKARSLPYAVGAAIAVGIGFLTVWANGAVGIVGDEGNPANAAFYGVVLFAALAAAIARGKTGAMAKAMTASAIAQVTAGVIVALMGYSAVIFTIVMGGLWLLAAAMFRKAARAMA